MAGNNKVTLPSIIKEDSWFYKDNEEVCKPHLNKPYISYSSVSSWEDYKDNFIKEKFAKIKLPEGIYAALGSYLGSAVEEGKFPTENPYGFTGQENFHLIERPENAKYERFILIDFGDYVCIGFVDIWNEISPNKLSIKDLKSGGAKKEDTYKDSKYIQVILYAHAAEKEGYEIVETGVWFVRRTGSHINPPLNISSEQFFIPLEYSPERVKYALEKVDRVVKEISDLYTTYLKFFK